MVSQQPSKRDQRDRGDFVRINRRIFAREVRVIDEEGNQLGVMSTEDAIHLAAEQGVDLVEVSPNVDPPVCRIMDYGKYKYQLQKKQQEARKKQTVVQIKEIKLRPKTDEHDLDTKIRHIRRFLEDGDRCKVTLFFRGREIVHKDRGIEVLQRVLDATADVAKPEQEAQAEGRTIFVLLAPLPKKEQANKQPQ